MSDRRSQQGSATVLAVAAIGVIVAVGFALVSILVVVSVRVETETAADAAALAAVAAAIEGRAPIPAASEIAAANRARLVRCRCPPFIGRPFVATVLVARDVRIPFFGDRSIRVERTAEYEVAP